MNGFLNLKTMNMIFQREARVSKLISMRKKWLLPLAASTFVFISLFLWLTLSITSSQKARQSLLNVFYYEGLHGRQRVYVDKDFVQLAPSGVPAPPVQLKPSGVPAPPVLAYLISGTKGDGKRMNRVLQALYHPRNQYVLHLDLEAPIVERVELARYVRTERIFLEAGNVHFIGNANLVTYRGPTMIASTLHAAAILLRRSKDWDWFINLSASDYPLITQDDLLHVLSNVSRNLNFIEHTSEIGWKESQRAKPIIMDPALYMSRKSEILWATQKRDLPTAFRLFTGSAWVALTRSFVEFCVMGWDNLPRKVLMYYSNFISSPEGYFHTVICNTPEYSNTTVNHDLHYITWDERPKQHPLSLRLADLQNMTESGAAFARKFEEDDVVLDKIDKELLGRRKSGFTPGGWCVGNTECGDDPCAKMGDSTVLKPGLGATRFRTLIMNLLSAENSLSNQCVPPPTIEVPLS